MYLVSHLNPFAHNHDNSILEEIYSTEEFKAILERERARSDRSGEHFSLVVFYIDTPCKKSEDIEARLVKTLTHRVRSIDVVGWVERRQIGTALPNTRAEGARKFAQDISEKIAGESQTFSFEVFTYPSDVLPGLNGRSEARPFLKNNINGSTAPDTQADSAELHECEYVTDYYECLFAGRMPVWKRIIDIIGATLGLVFLFPLFLLIAIVIKIVSPGPAFFRQERIGYVGKPFLLWKFRTMHRQSSDDTHAQYVTRLLNSNSPLSKLDDQDTRIFPFGRLLRKTCLDELPQLINVIRGEMSLIGPRPCIYYEAKDYLLWHRRRLDAMPGMTGLWQVNGKNRTTHNKMMRLDIDYLKQRSFFLDLKILLKTVPAIINQATDRFFEAKEEKYAKET